MTICGVFRLPERAFQVDSELIFDVSGDERHDDTDTEEVDTAQEQP